ncbi:MAG: YfhO family protein [Eubacteriales bacterium]
MIERKSLQSKQREADPETIRDKRSPAVFMAFVCTALLLTVLFAVLGFYPFGTYSVIVSDLAAQYAPNLAAYKNQFLTGGVQTYSFLIGMGKNTFGFFAYYLASPINFVTFLFPTRMISEAVLVLITIKLSLASAFMTLFLRRRFHSRSGFAIVFGIMYAFCSYAMVYMINIMWLDGFFLLPLLLFFIEQFLDSNRYWWRVALTLFVLFVSGFYIAYMVGIFSFFYLLARLFETKPIENTDLLNPSVPAEGASTKRTGKSVLLFVGSAVLAAGMSAAVLIPGGLDILGNPDQSAKNITVDTNFKFVDFFNQFFAGSFDTLSNNKPLVYCGLAVLFLCVLFFLNPYFSRRQKSLAGGALLVFVFSFNLSLLDLAWQLFDSPNWFMFRYSFLFVFVLLVIAYASFIHLQSLKPGKFAIAGIIILSLLLIVQSFGDLANAGDRFYINFFVGGLELLCLYAMSGVVFPKNIANLKRLVPALLVILICVEMACVNPLYVRNVFGGATKREPFISAFDQAQSLVAIARADAQASVQTTADAAAKKVPVPFYRMETDGEILDGLHPMNAGLYLGYPSISTFTSSSNKELNRFLKQLGYNTNYNYFTSSHMYSSVVTDSFLGIRYILSEKENIGGYRKLGASAGGKLFLQKNSQALPLLFTVNKDAAAFDIFAMESDPANKNLFVLQDELLVSLFGASAFAEPVYYETQAASPVIYNAIIKEEEPKPAVGPGESTGLTTSTAVDTLSDKSGTQTDSDLLGNEPVGKATQYGTTYLRISPKDVLSLTYDVKITSRDPLFVSFPAVERNDQADVYVNGSFYQELSSSAFSQIISLGSFDPGDTVSVSIRADVDYFSIIDAQFYYCNTALFEKELSSAVQGQNVKITEVKDGYVSAQVSVPEDQLLLTTIPYEKGWVLLVDGVKTAVTPYQDALISVPLSAGTHTITLSYTAPGMWAGAAASGAAIIVFAGAVIFTYRKRSGSV